MIDWTKEITVSDKQKERHKSEISVLISKLKETDYVAMSDYKKKKPDILKQRQEWRDEIDRLQELVGE